MNKLFLQLKDKFANLGLKDATIEEFSKLLYREDMTDEQINETAAKVEPMLKHLQSEADKARGAKQAAETRVKQLEEQMAKEKPIQPKKDDEAEEYKKILSTLMSKVESIEKEKKDVQRKKELDNVIEKLPDSVKAAYYHIDTTSMDDATFGELKSKIQAESALIFSDITTKGINAPFAHNARQKVTDEEAKSVIDSAFKGVKI